ncbi:MAG: VOC family protein [Pseudomonadota bacterium]|nr:VOC family protein [Pseudomonadota bacterium]
MRAVRLRSIQLNVADLARAERFYRAALGFEIWAANAGATFTSLAMRLGTDEIELMAYDTLGAPYPADSRCIDLWFQHFAIVVDDMDKACERLCEAEPIHAISRGGPQRLPPNAGSVTAFKFRDPDGHPLELLHFPTASAPPRWTRPREGAIFLGIDHSAITVADSAASIAFYSEHLGLTVTARSLNRGPEQDFLDDTPGAVVEVTALSPAESDSPHVELLRYREPPGGREMSGHDGPSDIAATQLVFEGQRPGGALRDPDGHRLALRPAGWLQVETASPSLVDAPPLRT